MAGGVCDDEHVVELRRETPGARVAGIGRCVVRRELQEGVVKQLVARRAVRGVGGEAVGEERGRGERQTRRRRRAPAGGGRAAVEAPVMVGAGRSANEEDGGGAAECPDVSRR